ncbi:ATP-binding cassette domain-containing protein [uncultured Aliiroseovarius sp.]|uniref:ABC transporter ATP-binding protein n=1 Tax=uncultured Aliiroseovarius sp. TaxID=1658783 RepID=UPI00262172C8|nr:ATP-binding cassette domain-containing protein [uncultured Aliiroseovarius sp.]
MAHLTLSGLTRSFGSEVILNDIDLDIQTGELIVFVGPSGCGKSTLLRMIAGLEKITDGTLEIDGQVMNDIPPSQRGIAMVFQSYALYPHMTVRDNMAFALNIAKKPKAEIDAAVDRAAKALQLEPYLDRLPNALSGGQRQRVAIGRAIVRNPKVYLFDEPLSNLDAALRVATRIEIAQLKEAMPESTMIYVTHDQIEAMTLADRIVVLANKGIAQVGSPLELYERPRTEFVAQFIGSPAMNLLPGKITATGPKTEVTLDAGGVAVTEIATTDTDMGRAVNLGIRPEDFVIADGDAIFEGEVEILEALGEVSLLYLPANMSVGEGAVSANQTHLIAKLPGIHDGLKGQSVCLTADPAKLQIFADGITMRR